MNVRNASGARSERDGRIDLLRGLALLMIFVDHIPNNDLAYVTLHNFGFSDAAELFVFLAGFSTATAYGRVMDRDGVRAGLGKVGRRCLTIYGVHAFLLLMTLGTVALWSRWSGLQPRIVGALLQEGFGGAVRGLMLSALPTYLDILPLYVVLLALFPLVWIGMRFSVRATLAASFVVYALANVFHLNIPNSVDPLQPRGWYFNPFTWQLIFSLGVAGSVWMRRRPFGVSRPVAVACGAYLLFAFAAVDAWGLWPAPFGRDFAGTSFPFALFGNEPKSFVTPWRLLHALALVALVLGSTRMAALSKIAAVRPLVCCGRHSLVVFAAGCLFALFGRLFLNSAGIDLANEALVNVLGLTLLLLIGVGLEDARVKSARRKGELLRRADRPASLGGPMIQARDLQWDGVYRLDDQAGTDFGRLLKEVSRSLQSLSDAPDESKRLTDDVRYKVNA